MFYSIETKSKNPAFGAKNNFSEFQDFETAQKSYVKKCQWLGAEPHTPDDSQEVFSALSESDLYTVHFQKSSTSRVMSDTEPLTAYICGPITGIPHGNIELFKQAQQALEAAGYDVLNPHEICEEINSDQTLGENERWAICMRYCIAAMCMHADKVFTLQGWRNSRGSKIEVGIAEQIGIEVCEFGVAETII